LLRLQVYNNLLPGSVSSQLDYFTSKVTAVVSVTLTAADVQGADLSEPLVLFWHRHWEGTWNKIVTASLISLKHSKPSPSPISIARKSVEGGTWILARAVVTYVQVYCIVLKRTSTKPHSPHTIVNVQSSVYHRGHLNCVIGIIVATCTFQTTHLPILPFTAILYILQKSKRM